MRNLLDFLAWVVRRASRLVIWLVRHVGVVILVLVTGLATVTLPVVYDFASGVVTAVAGRVAPDFDQPLTVRDRTAAAQQAKDVSHAEEVSALTEQVRIAETKLVAQEQDLINMRRETANLAKTVAETVTQIRARSTASAAGSVLAMPGEALPGYGLFVVVAATTAELADSCALMGDLYALELAAVPDAAIPQGQTEVCQIEVPSADAVWRSVQSRPWQVATDASAAFDGLPPLTMPDWVRRGIATFNPADNPQ